MQNKLFITNQVEKVKRGDTTDFLDPAIFHQVSSILNKCHINYNVLKIFEDAEKMIIYTNSYPSISLLEIETTGILNHKDILGVLFNHNINISKYGDIVISDKYYLPVLDSIKPYIISNITSIGNNNVRFIETNIDIIKDYHYNFVEMNLLVSSLRIDNVVSTITNCSRSNVDELFKNHFVFVNYLEQKKKTSLIKDNDIIGIRGHGKYRFNKILKMTNKDKYIISILKYK